MRRSFPSFILFVISVSSLQGQALSTSVSLPEWGLTDVRAIELARFSIVHAANGDRLEVRSLYDATAFTPSPATMTDRLDVADFTGGSINLLGGTYSTYGGKNGVAEAHRVIAEDRSHILSISYDKRSGGYAGLWMHLFNSSAPMSMRHFLDVTSFSTLAVAIRGRIGNEKVLLKVADEEWNKKGDALPVNDIGRYTPSGTIETKWQIARIPLKDIPPQLDQKKLATLVFEGYSPSAAGFELAFISFLTQSSIAPALPGPKIQISPRPLAKALWVWETKYLFQKSGLEQLLSLLKREYIDNVFLALPYDSVSARIGKGVALDRKKIGPVILALNAAGARVHALIGDKDFILPEKRAFVRNSIRNIIAYNKTAPAAHQFFGIHLDIEPYLFSGFGSSRQQWYIRNFLETLSECSGIAHEGNMQIGADIPAWFDGPDELTHLPILGAVNNVVKPVHQHVIDLMDNVVLMDYRTRPEGENGIVLFATGELEYAEKTGKSIFVGLETAPLPAETILTFKQPLEQGIPRRYTDTQFILVAQKERTMIASLIRTQSQAAAFLREHRISEEDVWYWPVERATRVEGSRTSFASLGAASLAAAMKKAEPVLRMYRSFAGYGIHYFRSFLELKADARGGVQKP